MLKLIYTKIKDPSAEVARQPEEQKPAFKLCRAPSHDETVHSLHAEFSIGSLRVIERDMWDRVQQLLNGNRVVHRRKERSRVPSPLAGLAFDGAGDRLTCRLASDAFSERQARTRSRERA